MPPPTASTPENPKRGTANSSSASATSKSRSPSRANATSGAAAGGVNRTRSTRTTTNSLVSARAAVKKPGQVSGKESGNGQDDNRAENASMVEDLRAQLRKAETESDEYQKEIAVLQSRLDEAIEGQSKLEESTQEYTRRLETLQKENSDYGRRQRELQNVVDHEKTASTREREQAAAREEGLNATIQRLRDSLAHRGRRKSLEHESGISSTGKIL